MGTAYLDQAGGGGVNTDDATATLDHVRAGKQVGIAGSDDIQTGTGADVGAQVITVGEPTGTQLSYTIKKGFHNGKGYAKQAITNRQSPTVTIGVDAVYTIPKGWYTGGVVKQALTTKGATTLKMATTEQGIAAGTLMTGNVTIQGDANYIAANIKSGVKIGNVTGTAVSYTNSQTNWTKVTLQ